MGLFDKKIKKPSDGFDDRVDEITKPAVPSAAAAAAHAQAGASLNRPAPSIAIRTPEKTPMPLDTDHPDYGINKAIELMRRLPDDNVELVVRVVKTTLESTNIKVASIIKDAARKLGGIEARVEVLKKEIGGLESEIATRRSEIAGLEADHKETSTVKERLVLAEKPVSTDRAIEPRPLAAAPRPGPSTAPPSTPSTSAGGGTTSSSDPPH